MTNRRGAVQAQRAEDSISAGGSAYLDGRVVRFGRSAISEKFYYPEHDLLEIQLQSFRTFLQEDVPPHRRKNIGLQRVFNEHFPVEDPRSHFVMEFLSYTVIPPALTEEECRRMGLTYAAKLRARFRVFCTDPEHEEFEPTEQEVYMGDIPYMTSRGTFIINGVERVVVNQIQRAAGIVFDTAIHPNGTRLYYAVIRPQKGQTVEFSSDVSGALYIYLDRRHKVPVTTLLRTFPVVENRTSFSGEYEAGTGRSHMYEEGTDKYLMVELLKVAEPVAVNGPDTLRQYVGRRLAGRVALQWQEEFVDSDTGEITTITRHQLVAEAGEELTEALIDKIGEAGVTEVLLQKEDIEEDLSIIYNTLRQDPTTNTHEALDYIHQVMRGTSSSHEARVLELLDRYLFSSDRCNLGEVGRYKLNKKLSELIRSVGMEVPSADTHVITMQDIVGVVLYIVDMYNGRREEDDKDSLSNKYIRTVGEILYDVFSAAAARLARNLRDKMNVRDAEVFTPQDILSTKSFTSVIKDFFATGELSQFADQTNPIAETSHKRRITALGEGGLTRRSAGVEVRDVHSTYYGRICPIETPEGQNIGLINNLAVHARINESGFIVTPYLKVKDGRVLFEEGVVYLTADEEEGKIIAQASIAVDDQGRIVQERVPCRYNGDLLLARPQQVDLVDISTNQILGLSASLIPFLEHDDAHRALMGANMQRQAVPLLKPEPPIVGTGMERRIVEDSRWIIRAEGNGVVEYADAVKIVVRYDDEDIFSFFDNVKTYYLTSITTTKYIGTNQNTAICLKPIVKKGQRVRKGQPLCEGFATAGGELALGKNLLVAFMPWKGYNFEDAIVISERLVQEDVFTSIHIFEEEETAKSLHKEGAEKITRDLPDVPESDLRDLTEKGIVRVGARVKLGSILIGKVVPRPRTEDEPPEAKLIRAIFPEKYHPYRNVSLRLPSIIGRGVVIATTHYSRQSKGQYLSDNDIRRLRDELLGYPHLVEVAQVADTILSMYNQEVPAKCKKMENVFREAVDEAVKGFAEKVVQTVSTHKHKKSKKSKANNQVEENASEELEFARLFGIQTAEDVIRALTEKSAKDKNREGKRKAQLLRIVEAALQRLKTKAARGEAGIAQEDADLLVELVMNDPSVREEVTARVVECIAGNANRTLVEDIVTAIFYDSEASVPKVERSVREVKDKILKSIINALREREQKRLRQLLIDRLLGIINGRKVQGIYAFDKGMREEIVPPGTKVTREVLESIKDFSGVDPCEWTGNQQVDKKVEQLLKSYSIELRRNKVEVFWKRLEELRGAGGMMDTQILERVKVYIAKKRKIQVGDKLAGRHGNKGVVARIARIEDMPFLPDGTPVDVVLNPLGVPSRMNIGQIYEAVLGWAGQKLGVRFITPSFDGATLEDIQLWLEKAGLPSFGETVLYNGETGEPFQQKVTVGVIYMMKLIHMVEDKKHARSTGPYSMITQQPLGGRSHKGGQRLGEMEVWALEAYGAAHCLQEMLTLKSDDIEGRVRLTQYLTGSSRRHDEGENGSRYPKPGIPESFKVLVNELRGLCLDPVFVKHGEKSSSPAKTKTPNKP